MDHTPAVTQQHYDKSKTQRIAAAKKTLAVQNREKDFPDLGGYNHQVSVARAKREAVNKEMSLAEAEKVISEGKTNQAGKRYMQVQTNPSSPAVPFILHPPPTQEWRLTSEDQENVARLLTSKPEKPCSAVFCPGNGTAPSARNFSRSFYRLLDGGDLNVADQEELGRLEERIFSEVKQ